MKHALGVIALALAVAACGQGSPTDVARETSRTFADATVLASVQGGDVAVFEEPGELFGGREFVALGEVAAIHQGPVVHTPYSDGTGDLDHYALVEVSVDEAFSGGVERIFVRMPLGAEGVDEDGKYLGAGPVPVLGMDEFAEAIPVGTRVVVAGVDSELKLVDQQTLTEPGYAVPEAAAETTGGHPQMVVAETADGLVTGWADRTFDEFVGQLRQAAARRVSAPRQLRS